jgi:hypothetical protein
MDLSLHANATPPENPGLHSEQQESAPVACLSGAREAYPAHGNVAKWLKAAVS